MVFELQYKCVKGNFQLLNYVGYIPKKKLEKNVNIHVYKEGFKLFFRGKEAYFLF